MKREFIMLGVSLGLFLGARKVNDWLDRCEAEEAEKQEKEEEERLKAEMKNGKVEEDDSGNEAETEPKKTK